MCEFVPSFQLETADWDKIPIDPDEVNEDVLREEALSSCFLLKQPVLTEALAVAAADAVGTANAAAAAEALVRMPRFFSKFCFVHVSRDIAMNLYLYMSRHM
jgi:hypothetical protein